MHFEGLLLWTMILYNCCDRAVQVFRDQISFDLNFYASVSRKRDIWNLTHSSTLQNTNNFLLWSIDVIFIKKKNKTKEPDNADKEEQLDKVDEQAGEEEGDEKEDVNNLKFGKYLWHLHHAIMTIS